MSLSELAFPPGGMFDSVCTELIIITDDGLEDQETVMLILSSPDPTEIIVTNPAITSILITNTDGMVLTIDMPVVKYGIPNMVLRYHCEL